MTPLQGLKALVIEDEAAIALMIEDMLADLGCADVKSVASEAEGLALVAQGGIDFALLDMNLGGERADRIADALSSAGIPFAFATGYGQQGLPARLKSRPVIQKPFAQKELAKVIQEALRR